MLHHTKHTLPHMLPHTCAMPQVCRKQYDKAMDFEQHLSSYDHHHTKRLAEMRAMQSERTRSERARKEARAMEKEMAKLQQQ